MTTNDLYQAAVANMNTTGNRYGNSYHTLTNGDLIICSVDTVAGRSIVSKHCRTTFGLKLSTEQYAKPVGRTRVTELLRAA